MSKCFMLTAGLGTRLRPMTNETPKPCLEFAGFPLLNYGFFLVQQAGFKNFVFNKHYLPEKLENHLQTLKPLCDSLEISDETEKILGSGGAIWKAKEFLKDQDYFLIANGDEVLIPQESNVIGKLINEFKKDQALCTLLTCDHSELLKTLKPVWVNDKKEIVGFGMDQPTGNPKPVHYTGYKVFSTRIFDFLPDGESNIFYEVLIKAIQNGEKVTHYHAPMDWYETGNPTDFKNAENETLKNHSAYLSKMKEFFS